MYLATATQHYRTVAIYSASRLVTVSDCYRLWEDGREVGKIPFGLERPLSHCIHPLQPWVVTVVPGYLELYDLATGSRLCQWIDRDDTPSRILEFSPDGKTLVSCGTELSAFRFGDEDPFWRHKCSERYPYLNFSPDSSTLLAPYDQGNGSALYELATGRVACELPTRNLSGSPLLDSNRVFDSGKVWDSLSKTWSDLGAGLKPSSAYLRGSRLLSKLDHQLIFWDLCSLRPALEWSFPKFFYRKFAISADGKWLVAASMAWFLTVWKLPEDPQETPLRESHQRYFSLGESLDELERVCEAAIEHFQAYRCLWLFLASDGQLMVRSQAGEPLGYYDLDEFWKLAQKSPATETRVTCRPDQLLCSIIPGQPVVCLCVPSVRGYLWLEFSFGCINPAAPPSPKTDEAEQWLGRYNQAWVDLYRNSSQELRCKVVPVLHDRELLREALDDPDLRAQALVRLSQLDGLAENGSTAD